MKLESLNNPKYSLTPEKMGQLVGGEQTCTVTGAGVASQGENPAYSADTKTTYDTGKVRAFTRYFRGDCDVVSASIWCENMCDKDLYH